MARRCLKGELPRVALDGPFVSPTQSAMHKEATGNASVSGAGRGEEHKGLLWTFRAPVRTFGCLCWDPPATRSVSKQLIENAMR